MAEYMEWLKTLALAHPPLQYLIVFLGAALGGELAAITLSFLTAQKFFSLFTYITASFLGVFCADSLYFYLGKLEMTRKLTEHRYTSRTVSVVVEAIRRLSRGSHIVALVFAKFLIGTRAVLIVYVSKTGLSFKHFARDNVLAIVLWLSAVSAVGFLSGLGFTYFSTILKNIYAGIGFLLLILLLFLVGQIWLKRFFEKGEKKI